MITKFAKKRKELCLTLKETAELLDRPYWTVVKWNNGDRYCHDRVIRDLELRYKDVFEDKNCF